MIEAKWEIGGEPSSQQIFHGHELATKCAWYMTGCLAGRRRRRLGVTEPRVGGQTSNVENMFWRQQTTSRTPSHAVILSEAKNLESGLD